MQDWSGSLSNLEGEPVPVCRLRAWDYLHVLGVCLFWDLTPYVHRVCMCGLLEICCRGEYTSRTPPWLVAGVLAWVRDLFLVPLPQLVQIATSPSWVVTRFHQTRSSFAAWGAAHFSKPQPTFSPQLTCALPSLEFQ